GNFAGRSTDRDSTLPDAENPSTAGVSRPRRARQAPRSDSVYRYGSYQLLLIREEMGDLRPVRQSLAAERLPQNGPKCFLDALVLCDGRGSIDGGFDRLANPDQEDKNPEPTPETKDVGQQHSVALQLRATFTVHSCRHTPAGHAQENIS